MTPIEINGVDLVGPGHVSIWVPSYDSVGAGGWTVDYSGVIGGVRLYSSGADGENVLYKAFLSAGIWTLRFYYGKDIDKGKLDFSIDAAKVVNTLDTYAAASAANQVSTTTGIIITSSGLKTLTLAANGKNAASSAYGLLLVGIIALWRTA